MKHNPLAQMLDQAQEERRYHDVAVLIDRRMRIPHYRDAEIRRAVEALNLGEKTWQSQ